MSRVGDYCRTGISRHQCECASCVEYRAELKKWNSRLAGDGLTTDAGTAAGARKREITARKQAARRQHQANEQQSK